LFPISQSKAVQLVACRPNVTSKGPTIGLQSSAKMLRKYIRNFVKKNQFKKRIQSWFVVKLISADNS